jgi:hypothetical protein
MSKKSNKGDVSEMVTELVETDPDRVWESLAAESEALGIGTAVYTADCKRPIVGIAWGVDTIQLNDAESYSGKRTALMLAIRLMAESEGARNDKVGTVREGEDLRLIAGAGLRELAEHVARTGPCAVRIVRGTPKKLNGKKLNTWEVDARTVPPRLLERVSSARKSLGDRPIQALAEYETSRVVDEASPEDDGR